MQKRRLCSVLPGALVILSASALLPPASALVGGLPNQQPNTAIIPPDTPCLFAEALGGAESDIANCVTSTQDGGFVVTGRDGASKGIFIRKFDTHGARLWEHYYHGGEDGAGRCVIETDEGDLVMVGFTSHATRGEADFLFAKYDSEGREEWMRIWGEERDDKAHGVIEAADGTIWVVGTTNSFSSPPGYRDQVVLVKLAADGRTLSGAYAGNPLILRDYSGLALAEVFGAYPGICVAGRYSRASADDDILLAKFSLEPEFWWARCFGDDDTWQDEVGCAIVRTSDAGLALAGWGSGPSGPMFANHGFLLKLDANADYDWARRASEVGYGPPLFGLYDVVETATDQGLVVSGGSLDRGGVALTKFSLQGSLLWDCGFGETPGNVGYALSEEPSTSLLVAGATRGYAVGEEDLLLARCNATGQTCVGGLPGPTFGWWTPEQVPLMPASDTFAASTDDWRGGRAVPSWTLTTICTYCPETHTVCPDGNADFLNIQDALDFAFEGDTIALCDAVFTGTLNRGLDFDGKNLTLRSQSGNPAACIIDCESAGVGFNFQSGEGPGALVEAITLRNGLSGSKGGGFYCWYASPTIRNCIIEDCIADHGNAGDDATITYGGAFYSDNASPTIENCQIRNCRADYGGGIYCSEGTPRITNCQIDGCVAVEEGGGGIQCSFSAVSIEECSIGWSTGAGIDVSNSSPSLSWNTVFCGDVGVRLRSSEALIDQCTIAHNVDYGVEVMYLGPSLQNTIVWGNGTSIYLHQTEYPPTYISCTCSDIEEDGCPGEHNIDEDPRFHDPEGCGDYHLLPGSLCAPLHQPYCGLIGAWPVAWPFPMDVGGPFEQR